MIMWSSAIFLVFLCHYATAQVVQTRFQSRVDIPTYADPDAFGYRHCAYWKLANGVMLYTDCDPFVTDRCGAPLQFQYRCCVQFRKVTEEIFPLNPSGHRRCAAVLPQWDFCPSVLERIPGYRAFAELIRYGDLVSSTTTNTFTIFAPYSQREIYLEELYGKYKDRGASSPVTHHIVKNRIYAKDLRDGMVLETIYGTKLKVNRYTYGVICIECVEMIEADFECRNGIMHMISKPLLSPKGMPVDRTSILSALMGDPRTKSFANDLPKSMQDELRNVDSGIWYTVFAPTEETWIEIRGKYPDAADREKIALNHVINKMHCSASIIRHTANIRTMLGEFLTADCATIATSPETGIAREIRYIKNECGQRRQFIDSDLTAGNGVIHIIDGVLIPMAVRRVTDLFECADNMNFKKFVDYISGCDLRMESGKKYAILIPMDYAFDWWKDYTKFKVEYDRFQVDADYRCKVARYHIAAYNEQLQRLVLLWHEQSGYRTNNIEIRHEVDYFLKHQYHSDLYFHYSPVVNFEAIEFADGSFYRLKRINVYPELCMVDVLKARPELNITYSKVVTIDMDGKVWKPNRPLNLYLATINRKWMKDSGWVEEYDWPAITTMNLFLLHTVPLYLWGGDIGYFQPNTVHKFMSRLGIELTFHYTADQKMRIGHNETEDGSWSWAEVIEFNLHAYDGIIWLLDGILYCPKKYCAVDIVEMDIYELYLAACTLKEFGDPPVDMERDFKKQPYEFGLARREYCYVKHLATYQAIKAIDANKKLKRQM